MMEGEGRGATYEVRERKGVPTSKGDGKGGKRNPQSKVREKKKLFTTMQIINVTIKKNLCGRLPGRKFPSSWPPMLYKRILFYI